MAVVFPAPAGAIASCSRAPEVHICRTRDVCPVSRAVPFAAISSRARSTTLRSTTVPSRRAGGGDEALLGVEDALGGVEVGTGDGVNRGPVDPPQTLRLLDAVGAGDGNTAAIEDLIDKQVDQGRGVFPGHVDGAEVALGFGADVPHLPGRPGVLHGGQHPVGGLRDPVRVGHARGFCGGGKCRRDH